MVVCGRLVWLILWPEGVDGVAASEGVHGSFEGVRPCEVDHRLVSSGCHRAWVMNRARVLLALDES
jgi:hypothetical protein